MVLHDLFEHLEILHPLQMRSLSLVQHCSVKLLTVIFKSSNVVGLLFLLLLIDPRLFLQFLVLYFEGCNLSFEGVRGNAMLRQRMLCLEKTSIFLLVCDSP